MTFYQNNLWGKIGLWSIYLPSLIPRQKELCNQFNYFCLSSPNLQNKLCVYVRNWDEHFSISENVTILRQTNWKIHSIVCIEFWFLQSSVCSPPHPHLCLQGELSLCVITLSQYSGGTQGCIGFIILKTLLSKVKREDTKVVLFTKQGQQAYRKCWSFLLSCQIMGRLTRWLNFTSWPVIFEAAG